MQCCEFLVLLIRDQQGVASCDAVRNISPRLTDEGRVSGGVLEQLLARVRVELAIDGAIGDRIADTGGVAADGGFEGVLSP